MGSGVTLSAGVLTMIVSDNVRLMIVRHLTQLKMAIGGDWMKISQWVVLIL